MTEEFDNKIRSTVVELVGASPSPHAADALRVRERHQPSDLRSGVARMVLVAAAVLLAGVVGLLVGRSLAPLPDVATPDSSLGEFPTELEFFASVVECTEERTGQEFGDIQDSPLGLASPEAVQALLAAQGHEPAYAECFQDMLPPVPSIPPITGYGDYSAQDYADIDWFEVTGAIAQCARDQGLPVEILPPGDGIGGFGSSGIHLSEVTSAVVAACQEGLNIPAYQDAP